MKQLFNFSTKWNNKLECDYFTTLRMSNRHNVGDKGIITLKCQPQFHAEIVAKAELKLNSKPSFYFDIISYLDTGYNWEETIKIIKKMYNIQDMTGRTLYLYLIRKTKESIEENKLI